MPTDQKFSHQSSIRRHYDFGPLNTGFSGTPNAQPRRQHAFVADCRGIAGLCLDPLAILRSVGNCLGNRVRAALSAAFEFHGAGRPLSRQRYKARRFDRRGTLHQLDSARPSRKNPALPRRGRTQGEGWHLFQGGRLAALRPHQRAADNRSESYIIRSRGQSPRRDAQQEGQVARLYFFL